MVLATYYFSEFLYTESRFNYQNYQEETSMADQAACPFSGGNHQKPSNKDWWPNQLDLK